MAAGRTASLAVLGVVVAICGGCVSLEEYRQTQAAQRKLEAEKAGVEQELYDSRAMANNLRTRVDSLEDQVAVKDQLVTSLQDENNGLEDKFRRNQDALEKMASHPLGDIQIGGRLPPELDNALQQFAAQNPGSVVYDPNTGMLKWTSDLVFPLGSDVVKDSAKASLKRFSDIMKSSAAQPFGIMVAGHTDNVRIAKPETLAKHPTNHALSLHRAAAVSNALQQDGIASARIGVVGYGEDKPIAPNDSEANRAKNRRVEMYVVPQDKMGLVTGGQTGAAFTGKKDAAQTTK